MWVNQSQINDKICLSFLFKVVIAGFLGPAMKRILMYKVQELSIYMWGFFNPVLKLSQSPTKNSIL